MTDEFKKLKTFLKEQGAWPSYVSYLMKYWGYTGSKKAIKQYSISAHAILCMSFDWSKTRQKQRYWAVMAYKLMNK